MKRVVFVGAYGIRNAGDDAPLIVFCDNLRSLYPDEDFEFIVIARHIDVLLAKESGSSMLLNLEYENKLEASGKWLRGFNYGDDRTRLENVSRVIRDADLVVAGAGNSLVDVTIDLFRGPIPLLATYTMLADMHRTPVMLYGISAGPLKSDMGKIVSSWIVRRSSVVTCRDTDSIRLLEELCPDVDSVLLPDPVLGLSPASDEEFGAALEREGISSRPDRPRLAIALRDLAWMNVFKRDLIVPVLEELGEDFELLFVPQCTGNECDDRDEARSVAAQVSGESHIIAERHSPGVSMRFYETADVTLAVRLHGAVFSMMSSTPVAALSYLPKVRSFMQSVGRGTTCIDVRDALLDRSRLTDAVRSASSSRVDAKTISDMRTRTIEYSRLAGELLELNERILS